MYKSRRDELGVYYNKCIELTGIFNNLHKIKYIDNGSMLIPEKSRQDNPQTGLVSPIYFFDKDKCPEAEKAIIFIRKGSAINNVNIINTDIKIDHIILQCDIKKTYNIPLKSKVWVYGRVGAYCAQNKIDRYDYCIDKIINIEKIE